MIHGGRRRPARSLPVRTTPGAAPAALFGRESTGLPNEVLADERVHERVRIPMLAGRRSLNLANSASIALYEAWRQLGFPDGV